VVVKRFRSWERREPVREWTALVLLAEFAPGLAPAPVRADLAADPPVVEMSRLPGVQLGGSPLTAAQADALVLALGRLRNAVPGTRLAGLGDAGLNAARLARQVTGMLTAHHAVDQHGLVRRAWSDAGLPADVLLGSFDLTAAEQCRVREYRRLCALFWLMLLLPGSPAHARNPPGTLERQAARLLLLLGR
jgi:hypothetical protein